MSSAKLGSRLDAPTLAPQPLAIEQASASEFGAKPRPPEPLDCLAIQHLGVLAIAHQRSRAGFYAQPPVAVARVRSLGEAFERALRHIQITGPCCRFDQLDQSPGRDV